MRRASMLELSPETGNVAHPRRRVRPLQIKPRDTSFWQAYVGALTRLATVGVSPVRSTVPWSA